MYDLHRGNTQENSAERLSISGIDPREPSIQADYITTISENQPFRIEVDKERKLLSGNMCKWMGI